MPVKGSTCFLLSSCLRAMPQRRERGGCLGAAEVEHPQHVEVAVDHPPVDEVLAVGVGRVPLADGDVDRQPRALERAGGRREDDVADRLVGVGWKSTEEARQVAPVGQAGSSPGRVSDDSPLPAGATTAISPVALSVVSA
jgi:hypothetical protein